MVDPSGGNSGEKRQSWGKFGEVGEEEVGEVGEAVHRAELCDGALSDSEVKSGPSGDKSAQDFNLLVALPLENADMEL